VLKAAILIVAPLLWTIPAETELASNASAAASECKLKLAHKTTPQFPKYLRGARSDLLLYLQVTAEGHVTRADVVRGTGNREVDSSVVNAVKKEWRYKPMRSQCEELITIRLEYHDRGAR
jgi:TonB family protein